MGKMKQLAMMLEEKGLSQNDSYDMEEAHYYGLVSNVANLIVEQKSTRILTDIEHAVQRLYINGHYSKGKK